MRSFLAVIDHGSLQAASRALGNSQPTMGRHVEQLEKQLNTILFERTGRGLVPTAIAHQIAQTGRAMQSSANDVGRIVQQKDKSLSGLVRISASRMVTTHLLPGIAFRLQQLVPDIDLAVVSTDSVSNLLLRDADIAIRMVKPQQSDLIAKRIGEVKIRPYASQSYIDRWGAPRTLTDLFKHRLIGPDKDRSVKEGMKQLIQSTGHNSADVRLVYRSDDFVAQKAAIQAGLGIGFSTKYKLFEASNLVELALDIPIPSLPLWLAVHREIRTTPKIRVVFDELAKQLKAAI